MKKLLTILIFLGCICPVTALADFILVSGECSGTWSADTMLVVGDVRVPPEDSLVIEPGVKVLFAVAAKIVVDTNATLLAVGTESEYILFDQYQPGVHMKGIRLWYASPGTLLEYCFFKRGYATGGGSDNHGGAVYCYHTDPTIQNCMMDSCFANSDGGAIFCDNANPVITGNEFTGNQSQDDGGAIYCYYSSPVISGNFFQGNYSSDDGAAIFCDNSDPTIENNVIQDNTANSVAGAIYLSNSDPVITGNDISDNTSLNDVGGIYLNNSDAIISGNMIVGNTAQDVSGGIYCYSSEALISNNTISSNFAQNSGGGIYVEGSPYPIITGNVITLNHSNYYGGGIYCYSPPAEISGNFISENSSIRSGAGIYLNCQDAVIVGNEIVANFVTNALEYDGGGIYCNGNNNTIVSNTIRYNSARKGGGIFFNNADGLVLAGNDVSLNIASMGGGIYFTEAEDCMVSGNRFIQNDAAYGGALYLHYFDSFVHNNTICSNSAERGAAIYSIDSSPKIINCIIRDHFSYQIYLVYSPGFAILYSDVQGGWTGPGNIDVDPDFVNPQQHDYRLQWGSPCIDVGHPHIRFEDPDSTRADMGAHFYDQSIPIRLLLTPYSTPIQIPAVGGNFNYDLMITNIGIDTIAASVWCEVTLPGGFQYGPVYGPAVEVVPPGGSIVQSRVQAVPEYAPTGLYSYNGFASANTDTSADRFNFMKLGSEAESGYGGMGGWSNWSTVSGDVSILDPVPCLMSDYSLAPNYPNPFNPTTTISFTLPESGRVQLSVFNLAGRLSATLVDGFRDAGVHEVTFDGSSLASGIYVYRLEAGQFTASRKMVLMK